MNVLSLFAGIGGIDLGLERAGMTTVGQVEIDPFCLQVLSKHWPEVPKHDDVRTAVDWWLSEERPPVDLIAGGFPCQDISNAGRRAGINGQRSGLWTYMADTVRALRPRYVFMENVSALVVRGLDAVAADLHEIGYDVEGDCVPASAVGAPHQRDRWWGVAYPQREQLRLESVAEPRRGGPSVARADGTAQPLAHAAGERRGQGRAGRSAGRGANGEGQRPEALAYPDSFGQLGRTGLTGAAGWPQPQDCGWWATEPDLARVANGVPRGVDRRRALGNAVVPQVVEHIGRLIVAADAQERAA